APTLAGAFVGNSGSHVFHRMSCRNSGCKRCTVRFTSRDAAIGAGYRPGGCCRP
ncbi:MAG: nuclease, partial [Candidatus Hydrogenedentes bacterium]|nr:nuclease [Candidatus Hydrogenedentota bacterium]